MLYQTRIPRQMRHHRDLDLNHHQFHKLLKFQTLRTKMSSLGQLWNQLSHRYTFCIWVYSYSIVSGTLAKSWPFHWKLEKFQLMCTSDSLSFVGFWSSISIRTFHYKKRAWYVSGSYLLHLYPDSSLACGCRWGHLWQVSERVSIGSYHLFAQILSNL